MCDMEEIVIREDDNGNRYIKSTYHPRQEHRVSKEYGPAWGVSGYGVFNEIVSIPKDQYDNFGITWSWSKTGKIIELPIR